LLEISPGGWGPPGPKRPQSDLIIGTWARARRFWVRLSITPTTAAFANFLQRPSSGRRRTDEMAGTPARFTAHRSASPPRLILPLRMVKPPLLFAAFPDRDQDELSLALWPSGRALIMNGNMKCWYVAVGVNQEELKIDQARHRQRITPVLGVPRMYYCVPR
jgi:hypothetical protein